MMKCQEFKDWLVNGDRADEIARERAKAHTNVCKLCDDLYRTDQALEGMLSDGLQAVAPPPGLIPHAREKFENRSQPKFLKFIISPWKFMTPALAMAVLVLMIMANPFSGVSYSVDEVATFCISNHMKTDMEMAFQADKVNDIGQWFTQRLGYKVRLPDMKRLELSLLGGRECGLGKINVALLLGQSKGKRASLFVINPDDVKYDFSLKREYSIQEGDNRVRVWEESGLVYAMVV